MKNRFKIMASITVFGVIFLLVQAFNLSHVTPQKLNSNMNQMSTCARDCALLPEPRTCAYDFTAEWYYTMSKGCFECPYNATDCQRPHCIVANGVQRPVLTINRQIPGPAIQVCQGDRIQVTVHNRMDNGEGITIHWHGQHQRHSPHMDGTSMITQCPIPHPQSFRYDFIADTPGTHWWHSHSGLQRADGIYGPLIVRQRKREFVQDDHHDDNDDGNLYDLHYDMYDIDDVGNVYMISDWTNVMAMQHMMMDLHADGPGEPDAILVNGRGAQKVFEKNGEHFSIQPEVFTVTPGLRYRLRTINAAVTNCPVMISIEDHKLTAIESDGAPCKPTSVDSIALAGGERYDFVVHADRAISNYWIRFTGVPGSECEGLEERAVFRYEGALAEQPEESADVGDVGVVLNFPLVEENTPQRPGVNDLHDEAEIDPDILHFQPDVVHYIEVDSVYRNSPKLHHPSYYPVEASLDYGYTAKRTHMLNNISFAFPTAPLLSHYAVVPDVEFCTHSQPGASAGQSDRDCEKDYCSCIHTIEIELGQVVELVLVAKSMKEFEPHPLHLHGNHFYVLAYDNGQQITLDQFKYLDQQGIISRNLVDPPRKDTVMMARRYAILRFKADNPGWWLFHCHMDLHLELGMAVVFRVGDDTDIPPPPDDLPACVKDTRQPPCDAGNEKSVERNVPPEETKCTDSVTSPGRSSPNAEAALLYIAVPSGIFVTVACVCFINIVRKFIPTRDSKYRYRTLSNGEMEMSLIQDER